MSSIYVNHLNQLPAELQYMILRYLGSQDLENYAATSRSNYQNAREEVKFGFKTESFGTLLEKPSKKLYNYYIDHHEGFWSCIMQLSPENAQKILHNISLHLCVLKKVIQDTKMQMLFNWQDTSPLHFSLDKIKFIIQAFPSLIPLIFKENGKLLSAFKAHQGGKAYLSDIISLSYEGAAYLLSRKDIVKYLLTPTPNNFLSSAEYLRDLPEPETLPLPDFENLYDDYPEDAITLFIANNAEGELPEAINTYLLQIINTCQQVHWRQLEAKVLICFENYFIEYDAESKYNLSKDLYSILEASILTTSNHISHNVLVTDALESLKSHTDNQIDDVEPELKLTESFMNQLKIRLIECNKALEPILSSLAFNTIDSPPSYMEQSMCCKP